MRLTALALPLSLAACAPQGDAGETQPATTEVQSHVIPLEYRGRWAESVAACLSHNTRRYEISAGTVDREGFHGEVEEVEITGNSATISLTADGAPVDFALSHIDDNTIRARYPGRAPFTLARCR
ncbi:hypothetical protein [Aurantiacibacter poecillastricola]|uniref:hypothetical protein n=1 Tax=Aurantiacibacter poecillastricola TaxID=3064385 RepID=UPI00273D60CD|nr:hypothetical protein [Aurantiacibacter sp. 219JJ12-13]MDP5262943.1 hypothetical protein [Aurantiacibacter sp. 219JJ12-13]